MLKPVIVSFICLYQILAFGQTVSLVKLDSLQGQIDHFYVDNIGNVYITNLDVVIKLNADLDTMFSSSLKSVTPQYIEASKSFRVLTFDPDRGVIQFLDNTLSGLSDELNLFDLDVVQPILVCESFNGNAIWVLDAGTLRLLKINEKFEIISQVDNLSFLNEFSGMPSQMLEYNDKLYLLMPDEKILVFDAFGTYLKSLSFSI